MELIVLFAIAAYGMTNILVYGSIFEGFRDWLERMSDGYFFSPLFKFLSELISCPMCTSTWVGFFFGLFIFSPFYMLVGTDYHYSWFFDGMLASGAVWAINTIVEWFED